MYILEVRLLSALVQFDRPYSYLSDYYIEKGTLVALPFGNSNRNQYGVVTAVKEGNEEGLKKILFSLSGEYSLTELQLGCAEFVAEQFFCSYADAARLMLPTGLDIDTAEYLIKGENFSLLEDGQIKDSIEKTGRFYLNSDVTRKSVQKEIKTQKVILMTEAVCRVNEKKERFVKLISDDPDKLKGAKSKDKYIKVLNHLKGEEEVSVKSLNETYLLSSQAISFLEKRGLVEITERLVERVPYTLPTLKKVQKIKLSESQHKAYLELLDLFLKEEPAAALLYGVTGSGKTSVILSLIDKAVEDGRGVIMLVPEIALTSQSAGVLFSRYGDRVALIHSGMSKGERHDSWEAIRSGKKNIVLGTRSALFAPIKNLGLLVIDEEQDDSYKSDTTPRYHARDVARYICAKSSALLLLSSATPEVTSFYNAQVGKYKLVTLTERYGKAVLPDITIADVMTDGVSSPERLIGRDLEEELKKTLKNKEQAILFVNRRGLRKLLTCRDCRTAVSCPNCSVSLTLHQKKDGYRLVCHYCGYSEEPPLECPTCKGKHMQYRGYGTQKLEEEIKKLFPQARVLRLDADTTRKKLSHDEIIADFESHKADILIGTQMVAKGHNFPDVTLVGVIMADLSLFSSDFRANEHTFSLMTQVVGRAGRSGKKGRAVIQTMNPYNETIELCMTQNYNAFFDSEIALRKALIFPPFCSVGAFYITAESESELDKASELINSIMSESLENEFKDVKIIAYGPFDAVPYKVKNTYRRKLVVKFKNNKRTRTLFKKVLQEFYKKDSVRCYFDASPTMV